MDNIKMELEADREFSPTSSFMEENAINIEVGGSMSVIKTEFSDNGLQEDPLFVKAEIPSDNVEENYVINIKEEPASLDNSNVNDKLMCIKEEDNTLFVTKCETEMESDTSMQRFQNVEDMCMNNNTENNCELDQDSSSRDSSVCNVSSDCCDSDDQDLGSGINSVQNGDDTSRLSTKKQKLEEWKWEALCQTADQLKKLPFHGKPGLNSSINKLTTNMKAINVVYEFFDDEFWQTLCLETNKYGYSQVYSDCCKSSIDVRNKWYGTTVDELKACISLCILQSQVIKGTSESYWSPRRSVETPFFSSVMPYERFILLSQFMHFVNNDNLDPCDSLAKIRAPIDYFNNKFKTLYTPEEEISIDESLIKCSGKVSFLPFTPAKRTSDIRCYRLCESCSGYCYQFRIYVGKKDGNKKVPSHENIIMEIISPLLHQGYTLYIRDWYTSPTVFEKLLRGSTNVIGLVRLTSRQMLKELLHMTVTEGEFVARYSHKMILIKWQKRKPECILSTVHGEVAMIDTGRKKKKNGEAILEPKPVLDYYKGMDGVDHMTRQLALYPLMHHNKCGYKTIFFYVLALALFNSYVLYRRLTSLKIKYHQFRLMVAEQLLEGLVLPDYNKEHVSSDIPMRLQGAHLAHFARERPLNSGKDKASRQCIVCAAKKQKSITRWECEACRVSLHVPDCFKNYHTKVNF